jgi:hypothetical protein
VDRRPGSRGLSLALHRGQGKLPLPRRPRVTKR